MRGWALKEVGAAVVIAAIVGMVAGFAWLALPADRSVVRAEATVISLYPGVSFNKYYARPPYTMVTLRLDDGREATLKRALACATKLEPGSRVQLAGLRENAGGMDWAISGDRCPLVR